MSYRCNICTQQCDHTRLVYIQYRDTTIPERYMRDKHIPAKPGKEILREIAVCSACKNILERKILTLNELMRLHKPNREKLSDRPTYEEGEPRPKCVTVAPPAPPPSPVRHQPKEPKKDKKEPPKKKSPKKILIANTAIKYSELKEQK